MTPAELKKAMRARKQQLRAAAKAMRKEVRARAEALPAVKARRERRRRIRQAIAAVIVALLLLLIRCDCGPGTPPPVAKVAEVEPPEPKPKPKVKVKPGPKKGLDGQGTRLNRGDLGVGAPPPPSWIDEFQLQVAARSPRLAQCFTGMDRPGALRWSVSVNGKSGATSDHEFEPVGVSSELSPEQRECVVKVLSNPGYKLTAPEKEALPNRISLVIEF